jgi:hypothetical protein
VNVIDDLLTLLVDDLLPFSSRELEFALLQDELDASLVILRIEYRTG